MYTTNEEDQKKAAALKARLEEQSSASNDTASARSSTDNDSDNEMCAVSIDEGANKYVLIRASKQGKEARHFVASSKHANYHRDAAEPMVAALERAGYNKIKVLGGGRIALDSEKKTIAIFGFSYGFGLADHSISKQIVEVDPRYDQFNITTSNEGYWIVAISVSKILKARLQTSIKLKLAWRSALLIDSSPFLLRDICNIEAGNESLNMYQEVPIRWTVQDFADIMRGKAFFDS